MAKSYQQIQNQIAALQKEAELIRTKQVQGVIREIKEAIVSYGLSAEDLGFAATTKGRKRASTAATIPEQKPAKKVSRVANKVAPKKAVAKKSTPKDAAAKPPASSKKAPKQAAATPVKFSDGNGNVWSGRGPRPQWLKDFIAQGKTVEEFRA
jgi:DNA-binding protein H-NS